MTGAVHGSRLTARKSVVASGAGGPSPSPISARLHAAKTGTKEASVYAGCRGAEIVNAAETLAFSHVNMRKPAASLLRSDFDSDIIDLMTTPPIFHLKDLGPQAQMMSKHCHNERTAMLLQYVALGCMIVMTGVAASQALRDAFGASDRGRGRDRSR
jgi:hypothetical protein